MTNTKRVTISFTDEIAEAVGELRKTKTFNNASCSGVVRFLILCGLETIRHPEMTAPSAASISELPDDTYPCNPKMVGHPEPVTPTESANPSEPPTPPAASFSANSSRRRTPAAGAGHKNLSSAAGAGQKAR